MTNSEDSGSSPLSLLPRDMQAALDKFDETAQEIVATFLNKLEKRDPPTIIYHYTNDVGLKGILDTGQIWLSDIFNLNDPSELSHGFSHAVNILNSKAENGPPESRQFAKNFAAFHHGGIRETAHYFVCSFSADGDDLGQWRAYADNGRGYAIGFDAKALENAFAYKNGKSIPNNSTFHLTYKDAVLVDIHRQIIESMFDLISLPRGKNLDSVTINTYMNELSVYLSVHALRASLFFKHKAYEHEKEYRFFQVHRADMPPEVKQRYRSYELVRYREFDWKQLQPRALKKIIVGPAADRKKATQFATDCITAFDIRDVEIECSAIPYRAL